MRKIVIGVAALVLSGSLALGGEGLGLRVDVGLEIGVVQDVELLDGSGGSMADGSSMALVPSLAVTYQFTEEWSGSLWLRYLAGFEDDSADVMGDDATLQVSGLDIGALAGYTLKLSDQFTVTPVAGLSWRSWTVDLEEDGGPGEADEDCSLLCLDLGAKAAFKLNDKLSIPFGLMLGLGVSGSADFEGMDGDLDGLAFLMEVKGGVEYRLTEAVALTGGLAYEMLTVGWDWEYAGERDDDLSRFSIQLGAAFKF